MIVAIDGTVCSGKSTIAKRLARALGFVHLNTGAIYRAVTLKTVRHFGRDANYEEIADLIVEYIVGGGTEINFEIINGENRVILDGEDVTLELNLPYISQRVCFVAKIGLIRKFVTEIQKRVAGNNNCVVEGRDIGTVVFPNAEVKFFMSADDEVRAKRRLQDYQNKGENPPFEDVLKEIRMRDKEDTEREISPLKPAEDSVIINNSGNDPDEMVNYLKNIVELAQIKN